MSDLRVYALSGIDYTAGLQTGYLLAKEGDAVLVDASADVKDIAAVLAETRSTLRAVLLTHCHFDHCANAARIKSAFPQAQLCASPYSEGMLSDGTWTAGFVAYPTPNWRVDLAVRETTYAFGSIAVRVIYTPGHTADSVCYLIDDAYLAAGDTLMNDIVCGNSHLPTGDARTLFASGQKLWREVADDVAILGGHVSRPSGEDWEPYRSKSTVGRAKHRNMINRL